MAPSEIPPSGDTSRHAPSPSRESRELGNAKSEIPLENPFTSDESSESNEMDVLQQSQPHKSNVDDGSRLLGSNRTVSDSRKSKHRLLRRPTRSKNNANNVDGLVSNSTSSSKTLPEVKYAKSGMVVLSQTVLRDRDSSASIANDATQVQPGETLYFPPNSNGKASGQYQLPPANNYDFNNNGQPPNNNYNNGNGNFNNGGIQPQYHPYNSNGEGTPHHFPPFISYPPHGQPGYPPIYYDPRDPHGQFVITSTNTTSGNGLNVRGEEVGIVLVVLLLWVGAIILFFNRWGKIRMLEPYQPKFCENHRPSCPMAEVTAISNHPVCRERTFSKFNLSTEMLAGPNGSPHFVKCNYHGVPSADPAPGFSGLTTAGVVAGGLSIPAGFPSGGSTGMLSSHRNSTVMMNHQHYLQHHLSRPRQNSVFVTSPSSQVSFYGSDTTLKSSARKTKSAVDLPTLVLSGEFIDNVRRNSKNSITQL